MGSRLESNSDAVRKRIENHTFDNEEGEEYEASSFGGFAEYFRRKKVKLQNLDAELRSQSTDKPPIFRGVVAHVNGYTQPSLNDLHKLIVTHGGGFMQYLDGKTTVTHIIASSLTPKKAVEFRKYRIVKPAWVVDSVDAGKLLPWDNYRVVDEGAGQRVLGFDKGKVVSQANVRARGYRDQTDASWYTSQLRTENGTPKSARPSSFLSQLPSTPGLDEEIDDLPPSHQPEDGDPIVQDEEAWSPEQSMITPPKSGPAEPAESDPDAPGLKRAHSDRAGSPSKRRKMTAEEHNAILLADPNVRKSTVVHPGFLEQYYRESRLHHLSTWKADLKSQLQAMAAEKSSSQKQKQKRPPGSRRYILHVDFDSFFAAVSLKKHPEYKDKPAVVAHGTGTGSEIASCNYPARRFGIKNGMWMKKALDLCPELKTLPYDFPAYEEASKSFYEAILDTGGTVQSVSIDEALIDVSAQCIAAGGSDGKKVSEGNIYREQTEADTIGQRLRDEVKEKTGCAVSVGIGPNILCAKVALRKAKPAGQYQIKPDEVLDFVGKLGVQDLPGVAYSIGGKLEEIGVKFVGDIRDVSKERLVNALGPKTGEKIWEYARGIDRTEVGDVVVRKSVSAEVNWGVRFTDHEQVDEFIDNLCGELHRRLMKEKVKGRQLTMKIMKRAADAPLDPPKHLGHGKCDTFNKSLVLGVATNDKTILAKEALSILKGFGVSPGELRGIGVQMTKLEPLKGPGDGKESSQRRLQFKVGGPSNAAAKAPPEDPIQDDITTPKKQRTSGDLVRFGSSQLTSDSPSRKPLNTSGTQFIMPSQVDPEVLAELPQDIRDKLAKHARPPPSTGGANVALGSVEAGDPNDPFITRPIAGTVLPNRSQLDPETLAALPDDVRAEVLSFYGQSPGGKLGDQPAHPKSPRKNRSVKAGLPKKPASASFAGPRKRGRPPKAASLAAAAVASGNATLTQSNFISTRLARPGRPLSRDGIDTDTDDANVTDPGETTSPDPDFLAALPEDIRREVVEEHRRARLRKRGGLALSTTTAAAVAAEGGGRASPATSRPSGQRTIQLPPRPPRPTFTTRKLWQPDQLREAVQEWLREFRDDGPYREDVEALGAYLRKVVLEERDLDKAVGLAKWFAWVVGDEFVDGSSRGTQGSVGKGKGKWEDTVAKVKEVVQECVADRGLGRVDL
ncbi:DNA-repair protein UmuC-like protein [Lasiodiplodia theobromae]|uniref:DNA repair protein REV1 n=1 Tax=Lasiodiplodia theobromae TaxID=45133 RepID=A0A5N5DPX5_9PEZI|nr:DNA repair protein REV1 [Lasiodiplodia theobromae]KAF9634548.1 DNA-repair protein UmuC-like protein [Lasiodiplodia theobromae]